MHTELQCGSHWALLAFAQIIIEWTKEISIEAIYSELHRRSGKHRLIFELPRQGEEERNKKLNGW
jgi:hypothetical protein